MLQLQWEKVWRAFKKLKLRITYDPIILLLSISKRAKNRYSNKNLYVNVHFSSTHNSKGCNSSNVPQLRGEIKCDISIQQDYFSNTKEHSTEIF